jgi:hypothetical protein
VRSPLPDTVRAFRTFQMAAYLQRSRERSKQHTDYDSLVGIALGKSRQLTRSRSDSYRLVQGAPMANPATLAAFVTTVYDGMGVRAASGATSAELKKIAKQAMDGWP